MHLAKSLEMGVCNIPDQPLAKGGVVLCMAVLYIVLLARTQDKGSNLMFQHGKMLASILQFEELRSLPLVLSIIYSLTL